MHLPFRISLVLLVVFVSSCANHSTLRTAACEDSINRYAHAIDIGDPAAAAEVFTETGRWQLGSTQLNGRKEIASHFRKLSLLPNRISRHVQSNTLLKWESKSRASATVYLTLYRTTAGNASVGPMDDQPFFVGHYEDIYHWDGRQCLIAERVIVPAFLSSVPTPPCPPHDPPQRC